MSNVSSEIVTAGGLIYFSADDGVHDFELWRSDGTEAGTTMVMDFHPTDDGYPSLFTLIGDLLLFSAGDVDHGYELWALAVPLFYDGFERGDTSAWSSEVGGSP
jgi:ELWxxDGT repeat protein